MARFEVEVTVTVSRIYEIEAPSAELATTYLAQKIADGENEPIEEVDMEDHWEKATVTQI